MTDKRDEDVAKREAAVARRVRMRPVVFVNCDGTTTRSYIELT